MGLFCIAVIKDWAFFAHQLGKEPGIIYTRLFFAVSIIIGERGSESTFPGC